MIGKTKLFFNYSINDARGVGKKAGQPSPESFRDVRGSIFLP
jgi:hypothetical protein